MKTHLDLNAWKNSSQLAINVFLLTKTFPLEERYGISSQMRQAAISVPSNISEGAARESRIEFIRFLNISSGSLSELETQLYISNKIGFVNQTKYQQLSDDIKMIRAQITGLKKYLKTKT